jgi:hypothetical protein
MGGIWCGCFTVGGGDWLPILGNSWTYKVYILNTQWVTHCLVFIGSNCSSIEQSMFQTVWTYEPKHCNSGLENVEKAGLLSFLARWYWFQFLWMIFFLLVSDLRYSINEIGVNCPLVWLRLLSHNCHYIKDLRHSWRWLRLIKVLMSVWGNVFKKSFTMLSDWWSLITKI